MMEKLGRTFVALAAAATIVAPASSAGAAPAAENCFIHTDDWVACVCGPVARLLSDVTGDPWYCA